MTDRITDEQLSSIRRSIYGYPDGHVASVSCGQIRRLLDELDAVELERDELRATLLDAKHVAAAMLEFEDQLTDGAVTALIQVAGDLYEGEKDSDDVETENESGDS